MERKVVAVSAGKEVVDRRQDAQGPLVTKPGLIQLEGKGEMSVEQRRRVFLDTDGHLDMSPAALFVHREVVSGHEASTIAILELQA